MQTSLDPKDWSLDVPLQVERMTLTTGSKASEKRRHFPFSAKLIAQPQGMASFKPGTTFKYARTREMPSRFPVEALAWTHEGAMRIVAFLPHEIELLLPDEG